MAGDGGALPGADPAASGARRRPAAAPLRRPRPRPGVGLGELARAAVGALEGRGRACPGARLPRCQGWSNRRFRGPWRPCAAPCPICCAAGGLWRRPRPWRGQPVSRRARADALRRCQVLMMSGHRPETGGTLARGPACPLGGPWRRGRGSACPSAPARPWALCDPSPGPGWRAVSPSPAARALRGLPWTVCRQRAALEGPPPAGPSPGGAPLSVRDLPRAEILAGWGILGDGPPMRGHLARGPGAPPSWPCTGRGVHGLDGACTA
jgi:hypothetical protein